VCPVSESAEAKSNNTIPFFIIAVNSAAYDALTQSLTIQDINLNNHKYLLYTNLRCTYYRLELSGPVNTIRILIDGGHFFAGQGALGAVYLSYISESATRSCEK
jgi:hypothetical protein